MKNSLAGDLAAIWREQLRSTFTATVRRRSRQKGVDLARQRPVGARRWPICCSTDWKA